MTEFSYNKPDIHGVVPDPALLGHVLAHTNGKDYTVVGYLWLGASDEWGFRHVSPEGVDCARPIYHIVGTRKDGNPRYRISESTRDIVMRMLGR